MRRSYGKMISNMQANSAVAEWMKTPEAAAAAAGQTAAAACATAELACTIGETASTTTNATVAAARAKTAGVTGAENKP